jgi:hypothetical protein
VSEAEERTPIEQAVEHAFDLFVYAPIGLLFDGTSLVPELIAKGKGQVKVARVMGKYAIGRVQKRATSATTKLQDQAAGVIDFLGESMTPASPEPKTPIAARSARTRSAKVEAKVTQAATSDVSAASLAIPDYDGLSASQVVNRLAGLSPAELESVKSYEVAHRGRKTILSKVAQLQGR